MNETRKTYLRKAQEVAAGRLVLLPEAPAHVPVLARDLVHLLELLDEYERAAGDGGGGDRV